MTHLFHLSQPVWAEIRPGFWRPGEIDAIHKAAQTRTYYWIRLPDDGPAFSYLPEEAVTARNPHLVRCDWTDRPAPRSPATARERQLLDMREG